MARTVKILVCGWGAVLALYASTAHAQLVTPSVRVSPKLYRQHEPAVAAWGDKLVAVWYRGIYGSGNGWSASTDGGLTWSPEAGFPNASTEVIEGQHPDVCSDGAGNFYAVLRSHSSNTLTVYRGTFGGTSPVWSAPSQIVPLDGQYHYDAPSIGCDPASGNVYVASAQKHEYTLFPGGCCMFPHYWTHYSVIFQRSVDAGATWSPPLFLSNAYSNGSNLTVGPNGEIYVVWEDYSTRQIRGRKSTDSGVSFGPEFVVGDVLDNLQITPAYWAPSGDRYNPMYERSDYFASSFPSIGVDRSTGTRRGTLYAAWTDHADGPIPAATFVAGETSTNDSYGNATPIEIGWDLNGACSYPPLPGEAQDGDRLTFTASEGTLLRVDARVNLFVYDEYATPRLLLKCGEDSTALKLLADVNFRMPGEYPPMIVSLPHTGRYYLELQCPSGTSTPYGLKLRSITPSASSVARDMRDVVLVSSPDGGQTWSAKTRVNDDPAGSDNALPKLAVDDMGRVQVAWYDWRNDEGCGTSVSTYWAVSTNGGQTFSPNLRVSDLPSPWDLSVPDQANIGDDVGLATSGNVTHVLWAQVIPNETDNVYAARIGDVTTGTDVANLLATPEREGVRVSWQVLRPDRITGYRLHRAVDGGEFAVLTSDWRRVVRAGEHVEQDNSASPGHRYGYRLELQLADGTIAWEGPVEIELEALPVRLAITRVGPNPFRDALRLRLAVPRAERVSARVYDVRGTEVALIAEGTLIPGTHDLAWDARAARRAVPPGVYFLRAQMGSEQATTRIVRLE